MIVPWRDVSKKIYIVYNKMNKAHRRGHKFFASFYCYRIEKKYQCRISPGSEIGANLSLPHPNGIVIGKGSKIGKNVTIYQQVTIGQNHGKYPVIGDNVIIYSGAKIIGDIYIGDNCVIGANAVVVDNVSENSIVGGVPAKKIRRHNPRESYI